MSIGSRSSLWGGEERNGYDKRDTQKKGQKDEAQPSTVETIMHWNVRKAMHIGRRVPVENDFVAKGFGFRERDKIVILNEIRLISKMEGREGRKGNGKYVLRTGRSLGQ